MHLLDRQRNRRDFLHELGANQVGQRASARAGDEDAAVVRSNADFLFHALQEFQQLFRLLGLVALIVLPDHLVGFGVDDHGLHRGRADVHADAVDGLVARLGGNLARLGENARGQRLGRRRRIQQSIQLNVNLGWGVVARSVLVRVTHETSRCCR